VASAKWKRNSAQVHQVSLISDVRDEDVPTIRSATERRDFVVMGRMAPYRNVNHVLSTWAEHVRGSRYRADRLIIWGTGEWSRVKDFGISTVADDSVEWRSRVYRYDEIREGRFSGFKGSLSVDTEASQSGAQLLSAQLGVVPIVSNVGVLPEYQAPTLPLLGPSDLEGLVVVLDRVANPDEAAQPGQIAQNYYISKNPQRVAAKQLANVLEMSIGKP
jgi:hypothetical protein